MPRCREATSTIKGYYFQFDYYILRLLYLQDDNASVCVEGIEDVDVIFDDTVEAVQCKYYEETKCVPSRVGEAVRPMLRHFAENKNKNYRYKLYGHYKSGQDSIPDGFDLEFAKSKFFTYKEKSVEHYLHNELNLSDADLTEFLGRLELQLDANTYEEQYEEIISQLQQVIGCTEYDARFFYYNNAVTFVKRTAVKKTKPGRTVSKVQFLREIGKKQELFDMWYIEFIGFEKYYRAARKQFFSNTNISPAHRLFLIDCDGNSNDMELVQIIMEISKKWSKISKREPNPFCPYFYFHGVPNSRLANVKKLLIENEYYILDGHEYEGSSFNPAALTRPINSFLGIRAKIINKQDEIVAVLEECNSSKYVYQFFLQKPFFNQRKWLGKAFQILRTSDVIKII